MVLSHPLSSLTFLRNQTVIRKVSTSLHWQLYNPKQMENYTPNVICLPMQDFELKVVVSEIDTGIRKFVYRSYINCMRRFGGDYVQAETE